MLPASVSFDSLEPRRLLAITFKPSAKSILLDGTSGADLITIKPHPNLINMMSMKVNAEERIISYAAVTKIMISGGAGNDTITVSGDIDVIPDGYQLTIRGHKGNDKIDVGRLNWAPIISGDDGEDHILVRGRAGVHGGGDNDYIESDGIDPVSFEGGDGDDTLVGGWGTDLLRGGGGDDRMYGGGGSDTLYGDRGADLLFPIGTNLKATGWSGLDRGYGGPGKDWFYTERNYWHKTDYDKRSDYEWGSREPNTKAPVAPVAPVPSPGAGAGSGETDGNLGVGLRDYTLSNLQHHSVSLRPIPGSFPDPVGFVVVQEEVSSTERRLIDHPLLGQISYTYMGSKEQEALRKLTGPAPLTKEQRLSVKTGVVSLGADWDIVGSSTARDGLVWYNVAAKNPDTNPELKITAMVMKEGSILLPNRAMNRTLSFIARESDDDGTEEQTGGWVERYKDLPFNLEGSRRVELSRNWMITPWADIQIVGRDTKYSIARDLPENFRLPRFGDRLGILVHGGVVWLPTQDRPADFTRLWN